MSLEKSLEIIEQNSLHFKKNPIEKQKTKETDSPSQSFNIVTEEIPISERREIASEYQQGRNNLYNEMVEVLLEKEQSAFSVVEILKSCKNTADINELGKTLRTHAIACRVPVEKILMQIFNNNTNISHTERKNIVKALGHAKLIQKDYCSTFENLAQNWGQPNTNKVLQIYLQTDKLNEAVNNKDIPKYKNSKEIPFDITRIYGEGGFNIVVEGEDKRIGLSEDIIACIRKVQKHEGINHFPLFKALKIGSLPRQVRVNDAGGFAPPSLEIDLWGYGQYVNLQSLLAGPENLRSQLRSFTLSAIESQFEEYNTYEEQFKQLQTIEKKRIANESTVLKNEHIKLLKNFESFYGKSFEEVIANIADYKEEISNAKKFVKVYNKTQPLIDINKQLKNIKVKQDQASKALQSVSQKIAQLKRKKSLEVARAKNDLKTREIQSTFMQRFNEMCFAIRLYREALTKKEKQYAVKLFVEAQNELNISARFFHNKEEFPKNMQSFFDEVQKLNTNVQSKTGAEINMLFFNAIEKQIHTCRDSVASSCVDRSQKYTKQIQELVAQKKNLVHLENSYIQKVQTLLHNKYLWKQKIHEVNDVLQNNPRKIKNLESLCKSYSKKLNEIESKQKFLEEQNNALDYANENGVYPDSYYDNKMLQNVLESYTQEVSSLRNEASVKRQSCLQVLHEAKVLLCPTNEDEYQDFIQRKEAGHFMGVYKDLNVNDKNKDSFLRQSKKQANTYIEEKVQIEFDKILLEFSADATIQLNIQREISSRIYSGGVGLVRNKVGTKWVYDLPAKEKIKMAKNSIILMLQELRALYFLKKNGENNAAIKHYFPGGNMHSLNKVFIDGVKYDKRFIVLETPGTVPLENAITQKIKTIDNLKLQQDHEDLEGFSVSDKRVNNMVHSVGHFTHKQALRFLSQGFEQNEYLNSHHTYNADNKIENSGLEFIYRRDYVNLVLRKAYVILHKYSQSELGNFGVTLLGAVKVVENARKNSTAPIIAAYTHMLSALMESDYMKEERSTCTCDLVVSYNEITNYSDESTNNIVDSGYLNNSDIQVRDPKILKYAKIPLFVCFDAGKMQYVFDEHEASSQFGALCWTESYVPPWVRVLKGSGIYKLTSKVGYKSLVEDLGNYIHILKFAYLMAGFTETGSYQAIDRDEVIKLAKNNAGTFVQDTLLNEDVDPYEAYVKGLQVAAKIEMLLDLGLKGQVNYRAIVQAFAQDDISDIYEVDYTNDAICEIQNILGIKENSQFSPIQNIHLFKKVADYLFANEGGVIKSHFDFLKEASKTKNEAISRLYVPTLLNMKEDFQALLDSSRPFPLHKVVRLHESQAYTFLSIMLYNKQSFSTYIEAFIAHVQANKNIFGAQKFKDNKVFHTIISQCLKPNIPSKTLESNIYDLLYKTSTPSKEFEEGVFAFLEGTLTQIHGEITTDNAERLVCQIYSDVSETIDQAYVEKAILPISKMKSFTYAELREVYTVLTRSFSVVSQFFSENTETNSIPFLSAKSIEESIGKSIENYIVKKELKLSHALKYLEFSYNSFLDKVSNLIYSGVYTLNDLKTVTGYVNDEMKLLFEDLQNHKFASAEDVEKRLEDVIPFALFQDTPDEAEEVIDRFYETNEVVYKKREIPDATKKYLVRDKQILNDVVDYSILKEEYSSAKAQLGMEKNPKKLIKVLKIEAEKQLRYNITKELIENNAYHEYRLYAIFDKIQKSLTTNELNVKSVIDVFYLYNAKKQAILSEKILIMPKNMQRMFFVEYGQKLFPEIFNLKSTLSSDFRNNFKDVLTTLQNNFELLFSQENLEKFYLESIKTIKKNNLIETVYMFNEEKRVWAEKLFDKNPAMFESFKLQYHPEAPRAYYEAQLDAHFLQFERESFIDRSKNLSKVNSIIPKSIEVLFETIFNSNKLQSIKNSFDFVKDVKNLLERLESAYSQSICETLILESKVFEFMEIDDLFQIIIEVDRQGNFLPSFFRKFVLEKSIESLQSSFEGRISQTQLDELFYPYRLLNNTKDIRSLYTTLRTVSKLTDDKVYEYFLLAKNRVIDNFHYEKRVSYDELRDYLHYYVDDEKIETLIRTHKELYRHEREKNSNQKFILPLKWYRHILESIESIHNANAIEVDEDLVLDYTMTYSEEDKIEKMNALIDYIIDDMRETMYEEVALDAVTY